MGRITSSVGLISGIPIEDTVKKLMAVASKPRDLLTARNTDLGKQQSALDAISSKLLAFQFSVNRLKADTVYKSRDVTSSDPKVIAATAPTTGVPAIGSFPIKAVQAASSQSLVSQRFDGLADDLGDGSLRIGFGGFVDQGIALEALNSGAGVQRGRIKITDRNGESAIIDLRHVRTVDDVLDAINNNGLVSVTAAASGDSFVLTDGSGGNGNLIVQEVGGGKTAASLGLAGINVASATATGSDVFQLYAGTKLASLNDGNGVALTKAGVKDLDIQLSDGTEVQIDLAGATTLGDVITKINAASPNKLSASIASDGNRLKLADLSGGAGDFVVDNGAASNAAEELGIKGTGAGGIVSGDRLVSGLRDSLLSSLGGGQGIGPLGQITVTDRSGAGTTINLSSAETLGDIVKLLNDAPVGITAAFNTARNGIVVTDTSGGSGNLKIANGDGTKSADALGLAVDSAVGSANSGALHRQTISKATLLSSLNAGKGVTLGDLKITDAAGVSQSVDLNPADNLATTVGDVIDRINALTNGVEARINDTGDGILLTNTATGSGGLTVKDLSGNVAKSLNLTRASKTITVDGTPTKVIDGTTSYEINLSDLSFSASSIALSTLNGGAGVGNGDIKITNSTGNKIALDLNGADSGISTVGQLIDAINEKSAAAGLGVTASINDAGTGIKLVDVSHGSGKLKVEDVGSGTTAAKLKIAGEGSVTDVDQTINGSGLFTSASGTQTGLSALAARINDLGAGVTASTVFDGLGYRLSLAVDATGSANQLLIDAGKTSFDFDEVNKAQDALLLYGDLNSTSGGVLLSSPDGQFAGSVGGVDLQVLGASETPVTVAVSQTDKGVVDTIKGLVDAYNGVRKDLGTLTSFDADQQAVGLLFGSNEALQIDTRLSNALTDRYFGFGDLQSLAQIGLNVNDDGTLSVDNTKLKAAFAKDPDGLQRFLSDPDKGVAVKLSKVIDRLTGSDGSVIASRSDALKDTIAANQTKIDRLTDLLDKQQERLYAQFTQLESIIASFQQSQTAISNLQNLTSNTGK